MVNETEAKIQARIVKKFKALGFIVFKMHLLFITGVPDLLFIMPDGRVFWMEVKRPGERLTKKQQWFHSLLSNLGHYTCTVTSYTEALISVNTYAAYVGDNYGPDFKTECKKVLAKENHF